MLNFSGISIPQSIVPVIVGDIKFFASENDPDSLRDQFNKRYSFGGGWKSFEGFEMDEKTKALMFPGDPPMLPLVVAKFRKQEIYIYNYSWVAIVEEDGKFEVSRMD